ncbi:MAG: hypothetical protein Q8877_03470, partial [Sweet potato little leaf phytoplasma]|nr:hypothetical protein [Sweet potato little leaf phytoplasma]
MGSQDSSVFCSRNVGQEAPFCDCKMNVKAVVRTARTADHYGSKFWGCRFYKVSVLLFSPFITHSYFLSLFLMLH